MAYEPQNQKQPVQNAPSSNPNKTGQAGTAPKDESAKNRMENEGGSCSTSSDKKSPQGGCN